MKKVKRKLKRLLDTDAAFTLIELLVVIAVISILATVILASVGVSRARAEDAKTKNVLDNVRSVAAEEKIDNGGYDGICTSSDSKTQQVIATLISQRGLDPDEYACVANSNEFAVAIPLKASDGYWCVDSNGLATQVATAPTSSSCNFGSSGGVLGTLTINLLGENPFWIPMVDDGIINGFNFPDPGYQVYAGSTEVTSSANVTVNTVQLPDEDPDNNPTCERPVYERTYTATYGSENASVVRTILHEMTDCAM